MDIIDFQPASYKGVEFIMLTGTTSGGRKDALFEFPNSDKQAVEDLGLKPRSYNITAVIPHDDYYEKRDRLLGALEEGGKGPLDHPMYGKIENIVARTFTLTEKITALGRAEIKITFAVSDDFGPPQKAEDSFSEVELENDALTEVVVFETTEVFVVDTGFFGNFQDAQELIGDVAEAFTAVVSTVTAITAEINQAAAQINSFVDDINALISLPQDLANSIDNIFSTVNGLFSTFESTVEVYTNPALFDFGDNDIEINETTTGLEQRASNRATINQYMQSSSLGYAYLNAVQIEFQTTDDIDNLNARLETQYKKIIANESFSEDVKRAATDVRTISNKIFDDKRLAAKKIIEVYTPRRPMSEIAYQYYGSTELTDTLLELNNISNGSFVEGTIRILTE